MAWALHGNDQTVEANRSNEDTNGLDPRELYLRMAPTVTIKGAVSARESTRRNPNGGVASREPSVLLSVPLRGGKEGSLFRPG